MGRDVNAKSSLKRGCGVYIKGAWPGNISASCEKMAFMRVSNNKKHTHCTCISHSITVY